MKRIVLIVGLLVAMVSGVEAKKNKDVISKEEGSITFYVDRDVNPAMANPTVAGSSIIRDVLMNKGVMPNKQRIVTTSFADDTICDYGAQTFFSGMVDAYGGHHAVVLSPDVIWLLISQGVARWINENPEEMRDKLVDHDGKMDLVVITNEHLSSGDVKWDSIVNIFSDQLKEHTKNGFVDLMTADFTTTGPLERMVSQAIP